MVARLPVDQSDNGTWGGILNEFLEVTHNSDGTTKFGGEQYLLATAASAGATTVTLDRAPSGMALGSGFLVIEPFSTNCEIRRVTSVAGAVVTLTRAMTLTASTIAFVAATKRITGTAEQISKFFPGNKIVITGSTSNNGTYTVDDLPTDGSYDATYITVVESLVDESAGASVTITLDLANDHAAGTRVLWTPGPISAFWYGAKASGVTGDATSNRLGLQRMLDDAYYTFCYDLYLPGFGAGRYYIDAPLYLEKNTMLRGPNQKSAVLAAAPTFATWNDDNAILMTRRNGRICRFTDNGADRYFINSIGIDGVNVAYAKSTSYSGTNDANGTAYVTAATNTVAIHATLITGGTAPSNNRIMYRALAGGTGGNSIRVAHVNDGASQPLTVTDSGNDITVHLATNGSSVVTSTANDVVAAVNAHAGASALVEASLGYAGDQVFNAAGDALVACNLGTSVVTTFALTSLSAGTAPFAAEDVGRSIYLGTRYGGARTIATFVNSHTVTVSGTAWPTTKAGLSFAVSPVNGLLGSYNQTSILQDLRIESCPGYAFGAADCQEFSVRNLMTLFSGVHRRMRGVQFGHFIDDNMEHTKDAYVIFETGTNSACRANHFIGGHIEDISNCDYWRAEGSSIFEANFVIDFQATTAVGSRVLRIESTIVNPPTYGFLGFNWSGPNSGPIFISDAKRGYDVPMTAYFASNNASCDHFFVRQGNIQTSRNIVAKTSAYTMQVTDKLVKADGTSGAFTVTLPPAAAVAGTEFTVKRMNSGANAITVDTAGAETFDGAASIALAAQYDRATVMSDGTNYVRVD